MKTDSFAAQMSARSRVQNSLKLTSSSMGMRRDCMRFPSQLRTLGCYNRENMLHIHNGDSSSGTARNANIPGEHFAWREALVCGPARGDLDETDFLETRAHHLSSAYAIELEDVRSDQREQ